jgi:hypothetical protein
MIESDLPSRHNLILGMKRKDAGEKKPRPHVAVPKKQLKLHGVGLKKSDASETKPKQRNVDPQKSENGGSEPKSQKSPPH